MNPNPKLKIYLVVIGMTNSDNGSFAPIASLYTAEHEMALRDYLKEDIAKSNSLPSGKTFTFSLMSLKEIDMATNISRAEGEPRFIGIQIIE
jgi:hypothetical protein